MTLYSFEKNEVAVSLFDAIKAENGSWVAVRIRDEAAWEVVRPRTQEAMIDACATETPPLPDDVRTLLAECEGITPGPWQSQHDLDRDGEHTIIGNIDGEYVDGRLHHTYTLVAEVYPSDNRAEGLANSRAIAKLPDLIAMLTRQAERERVLVEREKIMTETWDQVKRTIKMLRKSYDDLQDSRMFNENLVALERLASLKGESDG